MRRRRAATRIGVVAGWRHRAATQPTFVISQRRGSDYRSRTLMTLKLEGRPRRAATVPGGPAMELLNALLDLVDATFTAVGWVAFWFTWVAPRRPLPPPAQPSSPDELEHFLGRTTSR